MQMISGKLILKGLILVFVIGIVAGCTKQVSPVDTAATSTAPTPTTPISFKTLRDYPDQTFNADEYTNGMVKGGHNLLIWKDPAIDLSRYASLKLTDFGGRLLPEQKEFLYDSYIAFFNSIFRSSIRVPQKDSPDALLIVGAVVECNPGSRTARYLVGFGAGKAACAVVCEVYEPGKSIPCMRIYARDTASMGMFGGDSVSMLNNIMSVLGTRLATTLNTTIVAR
jgi:hypothetical protein